MSLLAVYLLKVTEGTTISVYVGGNLDAVKRKLVEAEALEVNAAGPLPHKLYPSSFVHIGLDIEDQQDVVWVVVHE